MPRFGSEPWSEPEPTRTGPSVQFRVRKSSWTGPIFRFKVQGISIFLEPGSAAAGPLRTSNRIGGARRPQHSQRAPQMRALNVLNTPSLFDAPSNAHSRVPPMSSEPPRRALNAPSNAPSMRPQHSLDAPSTLPQRALDSPSNAPSTRPQTHLQACPQQLKRVLSTRPQHALERALNAPSTLPRCALKRALDVPSMRHHTCLRCALDAPSHAPSMRPRCAFTRAFDAPSNAPSNAHSRAPSTFSEASPDAPSNTPSSISSNALKCAFKGTLDTSPRRAFKRARHPQTHPLNALKRIPPARHQTRAQRPHNKKDK